MIQGSLDIGGARVHRVDGQPGVCPRGERRAALQNTVPGGFGEPLNASRSVLYPIAVDAVVTALDNDEPQFGIRLGCKLPPLIARLLGPAYRIHDDVVSE